MWNNQNNKTIKLGATVGESKNLLRLPLFSFKNTAIYSIIIWAKKEVSKNNKYLIKNAKEAKN